MLRDFQDARDPSRTTEPRAKPRLKNPRNKHNQKINLSKKGYVYSLSRPERV